MSTKWAIVYIHGLWFLRTHTCEHMMYISFTISIHIYTITYIYNHGVIQYIHTCDTNTCVAPWLHAIHTPLACPLLWDQICPNTAPKPKCHWKIECMAIVIPININPTAHPSQLSLFISRETSKAAYRGHCKLTTCGQ